MTWFSMVMLAICLIASLAGLKVDPLYVTTFAGLLLAGAGTKVYSELKEPPRPPTPPANPASTEGQSE